MNILAIGAHPDDIEFGCAGTLIKYIQANHNIFLLVLSKGGSGGDAKTREAEQLESAKIMGAQQVFWGGQEDTKIPTNKQCIQQIENVVKKLHPDFIFVNYFDDTHQDHRHLANNVLSATRYTRNVLFYEGPTTQNFIPTVFVDIGKELNKKCLTLEAHASQTFKTNIEGFSIVNLARSCANFRGIQGRTQYAEGFMPQRLFINIGLSMP